jgi:hypothetical protein
MRTMSDPKRTMERGAAAPRPNPVAARPVEGTYTGNESSACNRVRQ